MIAAIAATAAMLIANAQHQKRADDAACPLSLGHDREAVCMARLRHDAEYCRAIENPIKRAGCKASVR